MPLVCSVLCEVHGVKDTVPTPKVRVLGSNAIYAVSPEVYTAIRGLYGSQEPKSGGTGSIYPSLYINVWAALLGTCIKHFVVTEHQESSKQLSGCWCRRLNRRKEIDGAWSGNFA